MADFGAIVSFVSRGSALSLDLYQLATTAEDGKLLCQIAKSISSFSLTVKQIGTTIKENDSLPSVDAIQTLHELLEECSLVLNEISHITELQDGHGEGREKRHGRQQKDGFRLTSRRSGRLRYLQAHLEALNCTVKAMLQTLYTFEVIYWARTRPSISPKQADSAVANEKTQLESLVIEQQIAILSASKSYNRSQPDALLITEQDCSQSLVLQNNDNPKPAHLFQYQDKFLSSLDAVDTDEDDWLPSVVSQAKPHLERLLDKWTRLRQLHDRLADVERQQEAEKRDTQQPTVESESEEEAGSTRKYSRSGARVASPTPGRPDSVQPLFTENTTLPIPVPNSKFGPVAPISPASSFGASPGSSIGSLPVGQDGSSPISPRSSISSLPVEAAAAVKAKDKDDDIALEIPWRLLSGSCYWEFIDDKVQKTNTDLPLSHAIIDQKCQTELTASWVCRRAIREAGYKFKQDSTSIQEGRRIRAEPYFSIDQALSFAQVQRLVERTVEIFRQTQPLSPPPRRPSLDSKPTIKPANDRDQDRTPLASQQPTLPKRHPTLERSRTAYAYPPPPPLDRSSSLPTPTAQYPPPPPLPVSQATAINPHATTLHLPLHSPRHAQQPASHPPQPSQTSPYSPHFPPPPPFNPGTTPPMAGHGHGYPHVVPSPTFPQSPLRQTYPYPPHARPIPPHLHSHPHTPTQLQPITHSDPRLDHHRLDHYSSTSTTSDSDNAAASSSRTERRDRAHRSRSRRPSSSSYKKKHSTVGTLAKVGGLAALLDGIVEMGVL